MLGIRRREFITFLGGAAAWPLAARAQQGERMRRVGVLLSGDENDPVRKAFVSAFAQSLAGLGWTDGRNVRMDVRWHGDDTNRIRSLVQELVGMQLPTPAVNYCLQMHLSQRASRSRTRRILENSAGLVTRADGIIEYG